MSQGIYREQAQAVLCQARLGWLSLSLSNHWKLDPKQTRHAKSLNPFATRNFHKSEWLSKFKKRLNNMQHNRRNYKKLSWLIPFTSCCWATSALLGWKMCRTSVSFFLVANIVCLLFKFYNFNCTRLIYNDVTANWFSVDWLYV